MLTDTSPKIKKILIEGYRKMTPQEKFKRVAELNYSVQQMALARIRQKYKGLTEKEELLRLASLWLDKEMMIKVFDWNPQEKGY